MSEHLTAKSIEGYQRRELEEAQRREVDSHLANCNECLNRVLDSENTALAFSSLTEAFFPASNDTPFHLSSAELKRIASGKLNEVERVISESHLETCEPCGEQLRQLNLAGDVARPAAIGESEPGRPTFWAPVWASLTPLRAFAVIALVGLIAVAVVQYYRQQSTNLGGVEVAGNPSPEVPPSSSPGPPTPAESPAGQSAQVKINDNSREIQLDQNGKLIGLEDADEATQQMARAALSGETLSKPEVLADLTSPPITTLGPSSDSRRPRLIGPVGRVVGEARPRLRWRSLAGADEYVVSIYDERFNQITRSPTLNKTEWVSDATLQRGHSYSWEVTPFQNGTEIAAPTTPQPAAKFRVLEAEKFTTIAKLRQQKPLSHLALGLAYAQAGLVSEAEREFRLLLGENPDSAVAKNLLATVQRWK